MGRIESGVGLSTVLDLVDAAREATLEARRQCSSPAAVLLFATDNYPAERLVAASDAAAAVCPAGTVVAGGTVPGVAFGDRRYDALYGGRGLAALAIGGGGVGVQASLAADTKADPRAAGRALAERVTRLLGQPPSAGIILSPGVAAKPVWIDPDIVDGIRAAVPGLPLAGGGASGGFEGREMPEGHVFAGRDVAQGAALLVGIAGVEGRSGVANGLVAERRAGTITGLEAPRVITSIEGRPAREAALELLAGDDARAREFLTKNVLVACVELGVTFAEEDPAGACWPHVPAAWTAGGGLVDLYRPRTGQDLVVARVTREGCLAAVDEVAGMLGGTTGSPLELTVSFSCSLRGVTLGPQRADEHARFRTRVRTGTHFGVSVRGEIGLSRRGDPVCAGWSYAALGLRGR
ncbi:MAG TPA: FIST N-terminal domain-containing protein [Polyangiaceae bacterium]|nr:FIST N-terminal domain-containing protein [Polyangiaceae bacterium]